MQMKYIIVDDFEPFIFSEVWTHSNFAFNLNIKEESITSAGFFQITSAGAKCYGESISLRKKSKPTDSALINQLAGDNL